MIKQHITSLSDLRQGTASVSAVYHGTAQVYPGVVRTDSGTDYGPWSYSGATRSRNATPWTQPVYQNGTLGPKTYGIASTQTENATVTTYWDGSTYWNAACSGYDSIDYQQVRPQYNWSDGQVTYGDWTNGTLRNKGRVEGTCGWVRSWTDWSRTGATCNSVGTAGSYDCSGDYTVRYHQEIRYLQFPDGSGRADTQYRANGESSRRQEDGVCGYVPISYELTEAYGRIYNQGGPVDSSQVLSASTRIRKTENGLVTYEQGYLDNLQFSGLDKYLSATDPRYPGTYQTIRLEQNSQFQFETEYRYYTVMADVHRASNGAKVGTFKVLIEKTYGDMPLQWPPVDF